MRWSVHRAALPARWTFWWSCAFPTTRRSIANRCGSNGRRRNRRPARRRNRRPVRPRAFPSVSSTRAALTLAGTSDPIVLEKLGIQGFASDIAAARTWYERAKEFGSAEAPRRLEMLASRAR